MRGHTKYCSWPAFGPGAPLLTTSEQYGTKHSSQYALGHSLRGGSRWYLPAGLQTPAWGNCVASARCCPHPRAALTGTKHLKIFYAQSAHCERCTRHRYRCGPREDETVQADTPRELRQRKHPEHREIHSSILRQGISAYRACAMACRESWLWCAERLQRKRRTGPGSKS